MLVNVWEMKKARQVSPRAVLLACTIAPPMACQWQTEAAAYWMGAHVPAVARERILAYILDAFKAVDVCLNAATK